MRRAVRAHRIRILVPAIGLLAGLMPVFAPPASAAHTVGTATLCKIGRPCPDPSTNEFVSQSSVTSELTVRNAPPAGTQPVNEVPPINEVRIRPGLGLNPTDVVAPAGWAGEVRTGEAVFTGGPMRVNDQAVFKVTVSVARFDVDVTDRWAVRVRQVGGGNAFHPTAQATTDALRSIVHVLAVEAIVASATSPFSIGVTARNLGTGTFSVFVALACSGPASPASQGSGTGTLAPNAALLFPFTVTATGAFRIRCNARANSATAGLASSLVLSKQIQAPGLTPTIDIPAGQNDALKYGNSGVVSGPADCGLRVINGAASGATVTGTKLTETFAPVGGPVETLETPLTVVTISPTADPATGLCKVQGTIPFHAPAVSTSNPGVVETVDGAAERRPCETIRQHALTLFARECFLSGRDGTLVLTVEVEDTTDAALPHLVRNSPTIAVDNTLPVPQLRTTSMNTIDVLFPEPIRLIGTGDLSPLEWVVIGYGPHLVQTAQLVAGPIPNQPKVTLTLTNGLLDHDETPTVIYLPLASKAPAVAPFLADRALNPIKLSVLPAADGLGPGIACIVKVDTTVGTPGQGCRTDFSTKNRRPAIDVETDGENLEIWIDNNANGTIDPAPIDTQLIAPAQCTRSSPPTPILRPPQAKVTMTCRNPDVDFVPLPNTDATRTLLVRASDFANNASSLIGSSLVRLDNSPPIIAEGKLCQAGGRVKVTFSEDLAEDTTPDQIDDLMGTGPDNPGYWRMSWTIQIGNTPVTDATGFLQITKEGTRVRRLVPEEMPPTTATNLRIFYAPPAGATRYTDVLGNEMLDDDELMITSLAPDC